MAFGQEDGRFVSAPGESPETPLAFDERQVAHRSEADFLTDAEESIDVGPTVEGDASVSGFITRQISEKAGRSQSGFSSPTMTL